MKCCPNCGNDNFADAVFCRHCGSILSDASKPLIDKEKSCDENGISYEEAKKKKKRGKVLALIGLVLILIVILIVIWPLGNQNNKDNPSIELTSNDASYDASYGVFLDRAGGIQGTINIKVAYGSVMPYATAPTKSGYRFKGYFELPNGQGTMYYNSEMQCAHDWNKKEGGTLYEF